MELPSKPEHVSNLEFIRNLTPYVFSRALIFESSVLDVGCGIGYGTWLLATKRPVRIVALDLQERNVRRVTELCKEFMNVNELVMDAQRLGFEDRSYEVVTCFEVIEHVPNPDMLFSELRRVLKETGILIITTPNRAVRLGPLQRPWNTEHLREYRVGTLQRKLAKWFSSYKLLGICGIPELHEFYRRLWRQSFFHTYFSWTLPVLQSIIPAPIRHWIRIHLNQNNSDTSIMPDKKLSNIPIPSPNPENWPFYVSEAKKDCLNFLAICGSDNQIVQRAANEIKQSSCGLSH